MLPCALSNFFFNRISELEERLQVAEKHRFPNFFCMHWDAAKNIIAEIEDFNMLSQRCPGNLNFL